MIYARQPTAEEFHELQRMRRQEVGRVSQRVHLVLLSIEHHSVPEIAELFQTTRVTVRFWIKRFNREGPPGLYDEPRSGRPRKVVEAVKDTLNELVEDDPQQEGYLATFWTVAMLLSVLAHRLKVKLSPSTLRSTLHRLGLRWGRPRLAMPQKTDPDKAAKQWQIAKAVVEATQNTAILYADESRIQLLPLLRAMWYRIGQQIRVPTPGSNVTRMIFGALNVRTGQWTYIVRDHMRKEDFLAFLEHLLTIYTEPILLIVDNYSSHTAAVVQEWLKCHPRMRLYYLPKYCSHLNPVEIIWLRLKNKIAANRLYASMKLLLDTVDAFFIEMTPDQALDWAGVEL
jgi:transposase